MLINCSQMDSHIYRLVSSSKSFNTRCSLMFPPTVCLSAPSWVLLATGCFWMQYGISHMHFRRIPPMFARSLLTYSSDFSHLGEIPWTNNCLYKCSCRTKLKRSWILIATDLFILFQQLPEIFVLLHNSHSAAAADRNMAHSSCWQGCRSWGKGRSLSVSKTF